MKFKTKTSVILCLICALILHATGVQAAKSYNIDFNDVEIRQVIETVSEVTGRNFLVDDRVQGKVTVIGPKSLTAAEIYQVFLSILQVKGFALVPSGKINKIVPAANIASYGVQMKVGQAEEVYGTDAYITQVIPVQYTEAEELKNLLAPLIPKTDSITAYSPTNLLIVTTTQSLLNRVSQVIAMVDVPGAREEVRIIQISYAPVQDLAAKISQVIQSQAAPSAQARKPARGQQPASVSAPSETRIIADERTNSIIAIGDSQSLDRIEELVAKLDVSVPEGAGKIHVYYLQHADASELSSVLSGIPLEETLPQTEGAPTPASVKTVPRAPARPPGAKSDISIVADTATNALVITATAEEYDALKTVIAKLDIPREQVLVEVLMAEVSFTKTLELGVEWRVAKDFDGEVLGIAGSGFGELDQTVASLPAFPNNGLVVGAIGNEITFNGVAMPNMGALIRALKKDSDVNILSTPTIVTTDNREAEIVVGQTVPFQTSQKFDSNNQPIFTFDYRDVGITVRLTPQINSNKDVKLDVFSKLEALVAGSVGTQELAPTTLKRQANTTVVVKDNHTVVIGGMIRDDKVDNISRVPILGSLPLIGPLFRSQTSRTEKVNLLIFLTPHVISSSSDLQDMAGDRVESFQEIPAEVMDRMNFGDDGSSVPLEEEGGEEKDGQESSP
jgi:general secretion pathway protein D